MAEVVTVVELSVVMHCEGCAGSVRKILKKIPGVQSYTVDYVQQKATVVGNADPEEILSRIRKSGKMASLIAKGPSPAPAPQEEKKEEKKEEVEGGEKKEEKKEVKSRFSFRNKMPNLRPKMPDIKMPGLKMPDLRNKMSNLKMQDLQKKMPDLCNSMPKNFMTHACREFMSKGVFYAATDDVSDSEKESLKP